MYKRQAKSYLMLLGNTELDAQRELGYLTAMQRNHVAGIILLGSYYTPQLAQALKNCRVPVVVTCLLYTSDGAHTRFLDVDFKS